jgi:hypothetical protein
VIQFAYRLGISIYVGLRGWDRRRTDPRVEVADLQRAE